MSMLMLLLPIFIILLTMVAELFLGIWTYKDAKARGQNAALWTLVVLLVPSFIGLIIYMAVGRNQAAGLCPSCSSAVQTNVKFCPNCGAAIGTANDGSAPAPKPLPRTGKGLLIAFIICIALLLLFAVSIGIMGALRFSPLFDIQPNHLSIGSVENSINRHWSMSFYSLDGEKKNNQLEYDGEAPSSVHVKASLGSGKLQLVLSQGSTRKEVDLSSPQNVLDIDLSDFEPGVISMTIVAENAKDGDVDISWD